MSCQAKMFVFSLYVHKQFLETKSDSKELDCIINMETFSSWLTTDTLLAVLAWWVAWPCCELCCKINANRKKKKKINPYRAIYQRGFFDICSVPWGKTKTKTTKKTQMHFKWNSHMMGSLTGQCSGINLSLIAHLDGKISFWKYVKDHCNKSISNTISLCQQSKIEKVIRRRSKETILSLQRRQLRICKLNTS